MSPIAQKHTDGRVLNFTRRSTDLLLLFRELRYSFCQTHVQIFMFVKLYTGPDLVCLGQTLWAIGCLFC